MNTDERGSSRTRPFLLLLLIQLVLFRAYPRSSAFIRGHSCFPSSHPWSASPPHPSSDSLLPAYPRSSVFIRGHSCFPSSHPLSASPPHPSSDSLLPCLSAFIRVHPWPFLLLLAYPINIGSTPSV